jgi:TonB family protein
MRRHFTTGVLVLSLVNVVFFHSFSSAQEAAVTSAQQPAATSRKIVNRVTPIYPELARRMQIHGTVKLEATVASSGKVKSTKVIGGSPVLTKAALDAIGAWKWAANPSETKELIELTFRPE